MKAIILAAGYGYRMRPLSNITHKTMLSIGSVTIIERIIQGLIDNDIKDINLVTGYKHDDLVSFIKQRFPSLFINIIRNERFHETNNIYSLDLALRSIPIDSDILIIESDLIFDNGVLNRIIRSRFDNVALVDRFRSGMDGTVVTIKKNVITSIIPPHLQDENFDFTDKYKTLNIYKFSMNFINNTFKDLLSYYVQSVDNKCYYELILGILIFMQREVIYAEIINNEKWTEIDDPNDLSIAEYLFNRDDQYNKLKNCFGGFWHYDFIDFAFIRNTHFPNVSILAELKNMLPQLIMGYSSTQDQLDRKLSYFLMTENGKAVLTNGLSQIYPILGKLFSDKRVLLPKPTFGEYDRCFINKEYYLDIPGFDKEQIISKVTSADVIVFVNPNNPTGSILDSYFILELAVQFPGKTFLIDESFIDFSGIESVYGLIHQKKLSNVLILKSLSKSLGCPGIRLGFVYSDNNQLLKAIRECLPIWNINSIGEYFLELILKHRDALKSSFVKTIHDRKYMAEELLKLPIVKRVYPSEANFLLVAVNAKDSNALLSRLLNEHRILIKDVSSKFDTGEIFWRIAVRSKEDSIKCIEALQILSRGI